MSSRTTVPAFIGLLLLHQSICQADETEGSGERNPSQPEWFKQADTIGDGKLSLGEAPNERVFTYRTLYATCV